MVENYTFEQMIDMSMCDFRGKLKIDALFDIMMNAAVKNFDLMGIGFLAKKTLDFGYLTAQSHAKIYELPGLLDIVEVTTWIVPLEKTGWLWCYITMKSGNKIIIESKIQYLAVMMDDYKPYDISKFKLNYDKLKRNPTVCDTLKQRISEDFSDCEMVGEHRIVSNDIDMAMHMNNVAYIRAVFSCFSIEELKELKINELNLYYRHPSYENENIKIMKRPYHNGMQLGMVNENNETVFMINIK